MSIPDERGITSGRNAANGRIRYTVAMASTFRTEMKMVPNPKHSIL